MEPTDEMVEAALHAADWPNTEPYIRKMRAALAAQPSEWNAAIEAAAKEANRSGEWQIAQHIRHLRRST